MGDVNVPGIGPVKKPVLVGGIAVLAGVLAVAYYRHAKNAGTAVPAAADTTATDPNAIDPQTGMTYAEEAAGITAGDLSGYGTGYGDTSGVVGYDAQGNPVYSDQVGYGPTPNYVNNAAWAQAAQQYLVGSTGADAGTVAAALGAYLNGQPLTPAQATVVQSAIGFFGSPPDAGSNGYPPSLNMSAPQGTTGSGSTGIATTGGGTTGGTVTGGTDGTTAGGGTGGTATGTGTTAPAPAQASGVTNGRIVSLSNNRAVIAWTPVGPATSWNVTILGPNFNNVTNRVTSPQATYGGLAAGHNYEVRIQPLPTGTVGGIDFKTKG